MILKTSTLLRAALLLMASLAGYFAYTTTSGMGSDRPSASIAARQVTIQEGFQTSMNSGDSLKAVSIVDSVQHLPATEQVAALRDLAKTQAPAAMALAAALYRCGRQRSDAVRSRQRAEIALTNKELSPEQSADIILKLEAEVDATARHCAGIDPEKARVEAYEYIDIAARLGDLRAQARYAFDARAFEDAQFAFRHPEQVALAKERAFLYAQQAAAAGSVEAMSTLGLIYAHGFLPRDDLARSSAWYLAAAMIGKPGFREFAEHGLSALGAEDAGWARAFARQIVDTHKQPAGTR